MIVKLNGKNIKVNEEEIEKNMVILGITKDEAIQMYLEDEGYLENAEVQELTKKARINKTDKIVATDKTKERKKIERKEAEDPQKEAIIKQIYQTLRENDNIVDIKVTNKFKTIDFYVNNEYFSINLTRHRQKKA